MGMLRRIGAAVETLGLRLKAAEGEYRPGPYNLPVTGGWLPDGASLNWWQAGHNPVYQNSPSSMVSGCVSAYAQTVAQLPAEVWRATGNGGRVRIYNVAAARTLSKPNWYQTSSDLILGLVDQLYRTGNAYLLGIRNARFEVESVHQFDSLVSYPRLASNGELFFSLYGNSIIEQILEPGDLIVPARDVCHLKLRTVRQRYPMPLVGESPIVDAYGSLGLASAITNQQTAFFNNSARPSGVLSTDLILDKDQVQALRDRWNEQSRGMAAGGTPILTSGLKVSPWGVGGKDSELAEIMKLTNEQIALCFRVPLQILGIGGPGTQTYASAEMLYRSWRSSGLGFCLNHVEEALNTFFGLSGYPDCFIAFNTDELLRSDAKSRMEALSAGVTSGIVSPNEARNSEGFDSVEYGDEPRMQAQCVPLSASAAIPTAPASPAMPAAPVKLLPREMSERIRMLADRL
jgi:HK97 family phage portal protein